MSAVHPNSSRLIDLAGSPLDRIVGFETEYAIGYDGQGCNEVAEAVARAAVGTRSLEYTPDGNRVYLDGPHPELSTAEEVSFIGAAHRLLAGHNSMRLGHHEASLRVQENAQHDMDAGKIDMVANTLDPMGTSWGCHENFLARRSLSPTDYIGGLALHHVSRIVWSGAGVVLGDQSGGFQYGLSEKAETIWNIANEQTTRNRALVNLRDTPLAARDEFRRIHIVCGDSVFNPTTNALRLASGSLVLRACELGVSFDDLELEAPIRAIREISRDCSLTQRVALKDGRRMTGIELQQALAERVIDVATKHDYTTEQERTWGSKWLSLLDDLQRDPEEGAKRLDWMVKLHLIERRLAAMKPKQSAWATAWAGAINYHRILPAEGPGMQLLRKGYFTDSPSANVLERGLALPDTRARERGAVIQKLIERGDNFSVDWSSVLDRARAHRLLRLHNPYNNGARVEQFLAAIA